MAWNEMTGVVDEIKAWWGTGVEDWDLFDDRETDVFVEQIIFTVVDGAIQTGDAYGGLGAALTNGILITVEDASGTLGTICEAITTNARLAELAGEGFAIFDLSGNDILVAAVSMRNLYGAPLRINKQQNQFLRIRFRDDFTNLTSQSVRVVGRVAAHLGPIEQHTTTTHNPQGGLR
jgi:hypothetical protein